MKTCSIISMAINSYEKVTQALIAVADIIPPLLLRLLLAVEFGSSGLEKFYGNNWFSEITFPFPLNLLPAEISWSLATYFELIGAVALILGLATRFISISLVILTIVAIGAVHWPNEINAISDLISGYRIIDEEGDGLGNYKLPLFYIVMFLPLIFNGAGRISLDNLLSRRMKVQHFS